MIQNGALQRDREQGASGRPQCLGSPQTYWTGWMLRLQSMIQEQKIRVDLFFVKCGGTSIYPLNVAQEQHTPQNNFRQRTVASTMLTFWFLEAFLQLQSVTLTLKLSYTAALKRQTGQPLLTEFSFQKVGYTAIVYAMSTKAMLFLHQLVLVCVYAREKVTASLTLGWEHQLYSHGEDKGLVLETVLVKAFYRNFCRKAFILEFLGGG